MQFPIDLACRPEIYKIAWLSGDGRLGILPPKRQIENIIDQQPVVPDRCKQAGLDAAIIACYPRTWGEETSDAKSLSYLVKYFRMLYGFFKQILLCQKMLQTAGA